MRAAIALVATLLLGSCSRERTLTACADPNNLPFSNRAGQGFENKLAELSKEHLRRVIEQWITFVNATARSAQPR